jgi:phosphoribosyl-ATP pyrophosphohydrolase/phosphoribosyl-AMP cyclohydrolase
MNLGQLQNFALTKIKFNQNNLVSAIVVDSSTNQVLMMAWMNLEAIKISLETGFATYFSRSRNKLWKKGETSGNYQKIVKISTDCDCDCLLLEVEQIGNACHTGAKSCFFNIIYNRSAL